MLLVSWMERILEYECYLLSSSVSFSIFLFFLVFASIAQIFCNMYKNWTLLHNITQYLGNLGKTQKSGFMSLFAFVWATTGPNIRMISILVIFQKSQLKYDSVIKPFHFRKIKTKISPEGEFVYYISVWFISGNSDNSFMLNM